MSLSENKLQWIAIVITAVGLVTSAYYNTHTLRVARIESELATYLQLNDHYNRLLFTLIQNDSKIFQKATDESLGKNKYVLYEMFELFSTIKCLEGYYSELDKDVWPIWQKRLEFLFSKPAVRYAWQMRMGHAEAIYQKDFVVYMQQLLKSHQSPEVAENGTEE